MELLGSSHLGEPKQYCRTGAQEDPWISAGDHPDLIVYGENGDANQWHTGTDGSIDALNKGEPRRCSCRSWSGLDQSTVCRRLQRVDQLDRLPPGPELRPELADGTLRRGSARRRSEHQRRSDGIRGQNMVPRSP